MSTLYRRVKVAPTHHVAGKGSMLQAHNTDDLKERQQVVKPVAHDASWWAADRKAKVDEILAKLAASKDNQS